MAGIECKLSPDKLTKEKLLSILELTCCYCAVLSAKKTIKKSARSWRTNIKLSCSTRGNQARQMKLKPATPFIWCISSRKLCVFMVPCIRVSGLWHVRRHHNFAYVFQGLNLFSKGCIQSRTELQMEYGNNQKTEWDMPTQKWTTFENNARYKPIGTAINVTMPIEAHTASAWPGLKNGCGQVPTPVPIMFSPTHGYCYDGHSNLSGMYAIPCVIYLPRYDLVQKEFFFLLPITCVIQMGIGNTQRL